MQKVRVISLESDRDGVVLALHRLGIVDLRKPKLELPDAPASEKFTAVSDMLIKVNGALEYLEPLPVKVAKHVSADRIIAELSGMKEIDRIYEIKNDERLIQEDEDALKYAESVAVAFAGLGLDFGKLKSDALAFRAFEAERKEALALQDAIQSHVHGKGHRAADVSITVKRADKKRWLVFVAFKRGLPIDDALKDVKVTELDLGAKYLDDTPEHVVKKAEAQRAKNQKHAADLKRELEHINNNYYAKLAVAKEVLEIELARAGVSTSFKRTEKTFVIEGWIPAKNMSMLEQALDRASHGRYEMERLHVDHKEELAPTKVNRPGFLKPFDFIMEFLSVPRSDEIDPTWIFILTFPIYYGLMVSDVGYGLASLIFSYWITKKTDPEGLMHNVARIWMLTSISAIFFGILSNEYFGMQLNPGGFKLFDWFQNAPILIAITVIIGLLQVCLGLAFGAINTWRHGERKLSVSKMTSITTIAFGAIAVSGAFFGVFSANVSIAAAVIAVASIVLTGVLSGIEAAEITNLMTHPLSYARIMGFGLGSIIIAYLIDLGFTPHLSLGIPLFILYAVIFIGLHFVNMILGIFEGLIQGVRLNVVEFFSKFYKGGGVKFKPFSYRRVYTEE